MNIPLDKLYHFLQKQSNTDILIYHWYPHGSRKLNDLIHAFPSDPWGTLLHEYTTPHVIFHDQEPLNFHYWNESDFVKRYLSGKVFLVSENDKEVRDFIKKLHLRTALTRSFNFYKNTIIVHSERNSQALAEYERNNFIGVYYWCHALIARDWFRYAKYDQDLSLDTTSINKDFLIYNRAWSGTREYRLKFAEMLVESDLIKNCNVKFNPIDQETNYVDHIFTNSNFTIARNDLELHFEINDSESTASASYVASDYMQSGIEVVLETLFDDTRVHLTEKALRPIACKKPFILGATAGSLQYLRDYGFKTFSPYINESYDLIHDPLKRLQAIVAEMNRISGLDNDSKLKLWQQLNEIATENQQLFFSESWTDSIVSEFKNNLEQALEKTKTEMTDAYSRKGRVLFPQPEHRQELVAKVLAILDHWADENIN